MRYGLKPYKDPWWLQPLLWLISSFFIIGYVLLVALAAALMVVFWLLGRELFIDFRGETYAVRWFRVAKC